MGEVVAQLNIKMQAQEENAQAILLRSGAQLKPTDPKFIQYDEDQERRLNEEENMALPTKTGHMRPEIDTSEQAGDRLQERSKES